MPLTDDQEAEYQYLRRQLGYNTPPAGPAPYRPGLFGRFGQGMANVPSDVVQGAVNIGSNTVNFGQPESMRFDTPQVPRPYDLPAPQGFAEHAVDLVPGIAGVAATAYVPGGIATSLGRAAGLGGRAAALLGEFAGGTAAGLAQNDTAGGAAELGGEFAAFGGVGMLPAPWYLKAPMRAAIPLLGAAARDRDPFSQESLMNAGAGALLPLLLGHDRQRPAAVPAPPPGNAPVAPVQPPIAPQPVAAPAPPPAVVPPLAPIGPLPPPLIPAPVVSRQAAGQSAPPAPLLHPDPAAPQAGAPDFGLRPPPFIDPDPPAPLLASQPAPAPLPPAPLLAPAPPVTLPVPILPEPATAPATPAAAPAGVQGPIGAALETWMHDNIHLHNFERFEPFIRQALPGAYVRRLFWDRNDGLRNFPGQPIHYEESSAGMADRREVWTIDYGGRKVAIQRPDPYDGIQHAEVPGGGQSDIDASLRPRRDPDATFADDVHRLAAGLPPAYRFGAGDERVFLDPIFRLAQGEGLVADRAEFDRKMGEALRAGQVNLRRSDFHLGMTPDQLSMRDASTMHYGPEEFHFLHAPEPPESFDPSLGSELRDAAAKAPRQADLDARGEQPRTIDFARPGGGKITVQHTKEAIGALADRMGVGEPKFTPAVRLPDGTIFQAKPDFDGQFTSGHKDAEVAAWDAGHRTKPQRGFVDQTGKFHTLMDIARGADPALSRSARSRPDAERDATVSPEAHHAAVTGAVDELAAPYRQAGHEVRLHRNFGDIDPEVQARAMASDPRLRYAEGFHDPATGTVHMMSENIYSPERAKEVTVHELSHKGVDAILPEKAWAEIQQHVMQRGGAMASEISRLYHGKDLGGLTPEQQHRVTREYIARLAENTDLNRNVWTFVAGHIRAALRKLGIRREWSDGEIQDLIRQAHRGLKKGKSGEVRAGTDPSYAGTRAAGFRQAEEEGRVFPGKYDGKPRFEIDDSTMGLSHMGRTAGEIMTTAKGGVPLLGGRSSLSLEEMVSHPELFHNYPELARTRIEQMPEEQILAMANGRKIKAGGAYGVRRSESGLAHTIYFSDRVPRERMRAVLSHEVQHGIQVIEGFAGGSSPLAERRRLLESPDFQEEMGGIKDPALREQQVDDAALRNYRDSAGEAEARDVAARVNLTPEQRSLIPPYSSVEGLPADRALIRQHPASEGPAAASMDASLIRPLDEAAERQERGYHTPTGRVARFLERDLGFSRSEATKLAQEKGKGRRGLLTREVNQATRALLQERQRLGATPLLTPAQTADAATFNRSRGTPADVAALRASGMPDVASNFLETHKRVQTQAQGEIIGGERGAHRATVANSVGEYMRRAYQIFTDPKQWVRRYGRGDLEGEVRAMTAWLHNRIPALLPDGTINPNRGTLETTELGVRQFLNNLVEGHGHDAGSPAERISQALYITKHDLTPEQWRTMEALRTDPRITTHDQGLISDAIRDQHLTPAIQERMGQIAEGGALNPAESDALREISERDTVAPEVRALFGEHTDPFEQTAYTSQKLIGSVQQARAISEIADAVHPDGRRLTYATAQDFASALRTTTGEARRLLMGYKELPRSDGFGAIAGHWAERGVHDALNAWNDGMSSGMQGFFGKLQKWMKINATILNPGTHAHNWMQAPLMMAIGRVYNPADWLHATRVVLGSAARHDAMRAELMRNNILGAGAGSDVVDANGVSRAGTDVGRVAQFKTGGDRALRWFANLYARPDDIVRSAVYMGEKARALGRGMSEQAAQDAATTFTNRYTWNYGGTAPAVRAASNIVGVNPFLSYSAELMRVMKNLGDDALHGAAGDRTHALINLGLMAAVPAAIGLGSEMAFLSPKDQDDLDKLRKLEPENVRAQIRFVLGRKKDGTFQYFDFKPMIPVGDPYTFIRSVVRGDWKTAALEQPFIGMAHNPAFSAAVDVSTGENQFTGKKLYTAGDYADRITQPLVPPLLGSGRDRLIRSFSPNDQGGLGLSNPRTGRDDNPVTGLLGVAGLRLNSEKPQMLLRYAIAEANEEKAQAKRQLLQTTQTGSRQAAKERALARYRERVQDINADLIGKVRP